MIGRIATATLAATALALPAAVAAADRASDPLVVTGADVPALLGADPGRVVAFRWQDGWKQVPVQVDERAQIDYAGVRNVKNTSRPFSNLAYADPGTLAGPDPDPALDGDDEIAAMASDAGAEVPSGADDPDHVAAGSRVELRISDPLAPGPPSFLYLYRTDGRLDPSAGRDYVRYSFRLLSGDYKTTYAFNGVPGGDNTQSGPPGNPEDSVVETDHYREHFLSRWITDELELGAPGTGAADILDGDKAQVGFACGRSELTFSRGGGGFIANIDGPVRAIRSYIGANSGIYTQRDQVFYPRSQVDRTYLRVHSGISTISQFIDYSAAAVGMSYRNSTEPAGVPIDGSPDPSVQTGFNPGPAFTWEQSTGPQGTLSIVTRMATNMPGLGVGSYYEDSASPAAAQCVGYADSRAYGASGMVLTNAGLNTDPTLGPNYDFTGTRTIYYSGPGGDAELAAARAAQVDSPLQVSLGSGAGTGGEIRVRAPKRKRLRVGAKKKLRVTITNGAGEPVSGVMLCATAKRRLARVGRCDRVGELGAGAHRRASVRIELRPRALRGRAVRVRLAAEVGGVEVSADRVKVSARPPRR